MASRRRKSLVYVNLPSNLGGRGPWKQFNKPQRPKLLFPIFRNGMEILKQILTQLSLYYTRFPSFNYSFLVALKKAGVNLFGRIS